jgi:SAM-dependent methyltransferase
MPLLSDYARKKKVEFFLGPIPKDAHILEVGSGGGWLGAHLKANGYTNYVSLDLVPPADVVGDVRAWRDLGLEPESFDAVVAFEVVEHVDCWEACHALLKPGGRMVVTTPVPSMDWVLKALEWLGLNQKRTSPHNHLLNLRGVTTFAQKQVWTIAGLSQWGVFTKGQTVPTKRPSVSVKSAPVPALAR